MHDYFSFKHIYRCLQCYVKVNMLLEYCTFCSFNSSCMFISKDVFVVCEETLRKIIAQGMEINLDEIATP